MEFIIKTELDLTGLKAMTKSVKAVNKRHIKYGWFDGKMYPASHKNAGIPIAQVANWQEYGASSDGKNIPARPYFRQAINTSRYKYGSNIASVFGTAIKGRDTTSRLNTLANEHVLDYSESVLRQNHKSLSGVTVSLKGHSYQMDDSGVMLDNFKAKVFRTSQNNIKD